MTKIYIIAGEASGDIYGAGLIAALQRLSQQLIEFHGIGGDKMAAQGLSSLFPMSEISIMGFWEILPHIPNTLKRINQTVADIKRIKPDMVITIDSPGFCCRVAAKLQGSGIKLVHYVAPTVWAYKPKRALKFAKLFDHLLVILPFEPPYFDKVGLPCTYVGHPIVETKIDSDRDAFREKYNISATDKLLCVMPGSRITEVSRLLPIFLDAIAILRKAIPDLKIVMPVVSALRGTIEHILACHPALVAGDNQTALAPQQVRGDNIIIIDSNTDKYSAYAASDAALVKSGTGTLEVAMMGCPMVIAYKISTISYLMIKPLIKIKFANLINLILDREAIPEMIQQKCESEQLAAKVQEIMLDNSSRDEQIKASTSALKQLGMGTSPSDNAARAVLKILEK